MKKTSLKIKLTLIAILLLSLIGFIYANFGANQQLKDGDIIFQTSQGSQSIAVQLATKSKYSHVGIIYQNKGKLYVLEAVQPVKITLLDAWIARGKDKHYVVKRLKNAEQSLTPATLAKMKAVGEKFIGKNYDLTFEWSDDKMYCSELVWKIYQRGAGIELAKLEKLKDFDLSSKEVKQKLNERYGNKIPWQEEVISPKAIFDSSLLYTVVSK